MLLTMFLFIFVGNELGLLPSPHILTSPTNDLNTTLGLALVSSFMVHFVALRNQGVKKHFKHYFEPFIPFVVINLMEEFTKPLTLAFDYLANLGWWNMMEYWICGSFRNTLYGLFSAWSSVCPSLYFHV